MFRLDVRPGYRQDGNSFGQGGGYFSPYRNASLNSRNLLATRNGRFLTFGLLYISEGIPYGFTSVAMVAFMRQQGV